MKPFWKRFPGEPVWRILAREEGYHQHRLRGNTALDEALASWGEPKSIHESFYDGAFRRGCAPRSELVADIARLNGEVIAMRVAQRADPSALRGGDARGRG
jgi:hypothetical protein